VLDVKHNRMSSKIATGLLTLFSGLAITASPMNVHAANYGGFGSTYSEVINPKDSELNDETKGSEDVKAGLASLEEFRATITTIKGDLVNTNSNHE
jgi:hypothetical protein